MNRKIYEKRVQSPADTMTMSVCRATYLCLRHLIYEAVIKTIQLLNKPYVMHALMYFTLPSKYQLFIHFSWYLYAEIQYKQSLNEQNLFSLRLHITTLDK